MIGISPLEKQIRPANDAGLTLIEILVILVIAGFAATLGVTSWLGWQSGHRVDDIGAQMSVLLERAHLEALRSRDWIDVMVDASTQRVTWAVANRFVEIPADIHLVVETAQLPGPPRIVFLPDGSSTGGTITLDDRKGRRLKIETAWATGTTRLSSE